MMTIETQIPSGVLTSDPNEMDVGAAMKPEEPVRADTVNLTGNVAQVEARIINIQKGAIGNAKGETLDVTMTDGGIGAMAAREVEVTINNGGIGALAAQKAEVRDATISVLAAGQVKLEGNSRVLVDLRAGALFGLIVGALMSLTMTVLRRTQYARKAVVKTARIVSST